jgi:hypothetical protein
VKGSKDDDLDDADIARCIKWELDDIETAADFVSLLREFENPICDLFAKMLEDPHEPPLIYKNAKGETIYKGRYQPCGGWKLILKRNRRGSPGEASDRRIAQLYDDEVQDRGERNAIKRVAQQLRKSPAAIRSAVRRAAGDHGKRSGRSGRK